MRILPFYLCFISVQSRKDFDNVATTGLYNMYSRHQASLLDEYTKFWNGFNAVKNGFYQLLDHNIDKRNPHINWDAFTNKLDKRILFYLQLFCFSI